MPDFCSEVELALLPFTTFQCFKFFSFCFN